MKNSSNLSRLLLLFGGIATGVVLPVSAQTADAIIAKARGYLGSEAALNAITSVHFSGFMEPGKVAPGSAVPPRVSIDIIFQKPYQQRIEAKGADTTDTTALDGYAAWQRTDNLHDPSRWSQTVLDPDQIKRLRANTWENLNFYKGIEQSGGSVTDLGPVTLNGKPAVKLAFRHDVGIVFYRYFDPQTGKLLLTETEQGGTIQEEGEIMVNGLRFPKRVTQTVKGVDAKGQPLEQKLIMDFDKITINEVFPDSDFEMPLACPDVPPPSESPPAPPAATQPGQPPQPKAVSTPPAAPAPAAAGK